MQKCSHYRRILLKLQYGERARVTEIKFMGISVCVLKKKLGEMPHKTENSNKASLCCKNSTPDNYRWLMKIT